MRIEERKESFKKYILGMLFDLKMERKEKEKLVEEIAKNIIENRIYGDRDEYYKMTLGSIAFVDLPDDEKRAIATKISRWR